MEISLDLGCHKGSVLGPILFLVYINDFEEGVTGSIFTFADDTKLLKCKKTFVQSEMQPLDHATLHRFRYIYFRVT